MNSIVYLFYKREISVGIFKYLTEIAPITHVIYVNTIIAFNSQKKARVVPIYGQT